MVSFYSSWRGPPGDDNRTVPTLGRVVWGGPRGGTKDTSAANDKPCFGELRYDIVIMDGEIIPHFCFKLSLGRMKLIRNYLCKCMLLSCLIQCAPA